nr:retrovirus-related Pol polyprotein from transposon TNT 1-94 [Tanacetum cinerariifolium]
MAGLWFRMFRVNKIEVRGPIHEVEGQLGHIARNYTQPKCPQKSDYYKDKMLLMQAQENGVALDEEQLLFLAGRQDNAFDEDVDEQPAPMAQTMFMANLSSADPVYDEASPSYDSDILSEEQVKLYERRARFELTKREQKINEQLRIVITNRNFKKETLKKELHSIKLQLASTINHNKLMVEEVTSLKKDFKQKQKKYLEDFLEMKSLKEKVEDRLFKQDQSLQTVYMLCRPKPYYNKLNKVAIGYKNPLCLTRRNQVQPALYNGYEIIKDNHVSAIVHNTEDTLKIAKITRRKMNDKIKHPECVNHKMKTEALKEQTTASRPIKGLTVYPPNTPATLVLMLLPTKSQVKIHIFTLIQLFSKFDKTCKKRITPTGLTEGEMGFEQTKECYLKEDNVIKQLKKKISHLQETGSEADRTLNFRALDSQITQLTKKVTVLQAQNDLFKAEKEKIKQHYKELYDSIKIMHAKHIEQVTALTTENVNLKAQILNNVNSVNKDHVKPTILTPAKYAIDVKPLPSRLRNNRESHFNYLRHLKESVETIREIVEEAKVVRPLDSSIVSACRVNRCTNASESQPRSNTKKNRISPAKGVNKMNVEEHPRTNKSHLRTSNRVDSSSRSKRILSKFGNLSKLGKYGNPQAKYLSVLVINEDPQFIGTVRFWNDHFGAIMGYGDYVIGDSVISRVYYVAGLGNNLFFVGQFCDSDLEVAFRKHSCYVRDMDGVALIKGSHGSNLYTISVEDMMKSSPICLLSKASKNKSWLWHQRLNHLNFGTINDLGRKDFVRGLPRLKFEKDHLCFACQLGKRKKHTHKP